MAAVPPRHATYRSINTPLTIMGAERRLFFGGLIVGGMAFNFFGSLFGGLALFIALHTIACWVTTRDPQLPRILLNSARLHQLYDPSIIAPWEAPWSEQRQ